MELHATTVVWEGDGRITIYDKTQGAPNSAHLRRRTSSASTRTRCTSIASFVGGAFRLRACGRSTSSSSRCWRRKRSSARCASCSRASRCSRSATARTPSSALKLGADAERQARSDHARRVRQHLALRGLSRERSSTGRARSTSAAEHAARLQARASSTCTRPCRHARARRRDRRVRARIGDGRARVRGRHRSARAAPAQLRREDQNEGKPFSSKALRECYTQARRALRLVAAATASRARCATATMLIGWGMATGVWDAMRRRASAQAVLHRDGRLEVASATTDIGTGTYTVMTQIAAEALGLPLEDVTFKLGDSTLPGAGRRRLVDRGHGRLGGARSVRRSARDGSSGSRASMADSPLAGREARRRRRSPTASIALSATRRRRVAIVDILRHSGVATIVEETESQARRQRRQNASRATRTRRCSSKCGSTRTSARCA